jgi:hypothetical protein
MIVIPKHLGELRSIALGQSLLGLGIMCEDLSERHNLGVFLCD